MNGQSNLAQSRTGYILSQAIGSEFEYYRNALRQPDITVLIKLGGAIVASQLEAVTSAVQTLVELDIYPAIIHGAGPQIDEKLAAVGVAEKKINGKRVTNEATLSVVEQTLQTVNEAIVRSLELKGVSALSITDGVFLADYLDKDTYGFVGATPVVNVAPITKALGRSCVPVISCLGSDARGQRLNINGDTASAALAGRLMVRKFVTLCDAGGVLDQHSSIIPVLNIKSGVIDKLIANGTITDGMIPKMEEIAASVEELADDASAVITHPRSLIRELFTHAGEGTLIRKGDEIIHYSSVRAVNHQMIRQLIELSFAGKLRKDYFTNLPEQAEVFTTAQVYNGVAIVVPGAAVRGVAQPAYLDKLVIRPGFQGLGMGRELLDAVISNYAGGLYWRTKTSNHKQIEWYSEIADSRMVADGWTVFMVGVTAKHQSQCLKNAIGVEPSVIY